MGDRKGGKKGKRGKEENKRERGIGWENLINAINNFINCLRC